MIIDSIILLESQRVDNLYPFSILHSGWELRCGALRLFEKLKRIFPDTRIIYNGRRNRLDSFLARFDHDLQSIKKENILVLSSEVLPSQKLFDNINAEYEKFINDNPDKPKTAIFTIDAQSAVSNKEVIQGYPFGMFIPKEELVNPGEKDKDFIPGMMTDFYDILHKIEIPDVNTIHYLWDAIRLNGAAIKDDAVLFSNEKNDYDSLANNGVHLNNQNDILIGENTKIAPGAVLDAEEGPIIIGNSVRIMPNAVIIGPCAIGDHSLIKVGAKIYKDTSFGEYCKVGGEVENTIIQSYSNKQHEGFLGHSYICEWVNLGADTNNSDLKNTYSNIKVMLEEREVDTESMFMGLLCGDHTKSAINTSFTTGTVAGICGILVHDGFLPRYIPSYAWTGRKNSPIYKVGKAIEIAKIVMGRRGRNLLPEEELLLIQEYNRAKEKFYK